MFTTDNSTFTADERATLNTAARRLLIERVDDDAPADMAREVEKTIADDLTNAWYDGATVEGLLARVRGGHA